MTQPMRSDEYVLPEHNVIGLDGQPVNIEPPAGMLANALAEEEAKPKKPKGRPAGSKNRKPKSKRAKSAKAPAVPATVPETPKPVVAQRNIAPSGEGVWDRLKRVNESTWMLVALIVAGISVGVALAFLTGAVRL